MAVPTAHCARCFASCPMSLRRCSLLMLNPGESETVTIANGAPGVMNISLNAKLPGIEGKLDRTSLKAGEKATLSLRAGDDAKPGVRVLNVVVEQTGQLLPITSFQRQ